MATNLAKSYNITVYNRSKGRADQLLAASPPGRVTVLESPEEIASKCSIVFSCLADDSALLAVANRLFPSLRHSRSIYVDCSTVSVRTTATIAALATQHNVKYVASPVFGRPDAALAAKLVSIPAGPPDALAVIKPYIETWSRAIIPLGEDPTAACAMKLSGNLMIASTLEILGESMTLAEKNNVARSDFVQVIDLLFGGPVPSGYAHRMAQPDSLFKEAGFITDLAKKDVGHMRQLGEDSKVSLPVVDIVMQRLTALRANGYGNVDWCAVGLWNLREAGLPMGIEHAQNK